MWIREGHGGTVYSRVDQTNKIKTKKKRLQFKNFPKFWFSSQNSCNFSWILKWKPKKKKKKRSSSQNFYEILCESTKIPKIRAVNTNLGVLDLDLHSKIASSLLIFSGHSPRLGGHNFCFGDTAPECPPPWRRACVTIKHNKLIGFLTICDTPPEDKCKAHTP